EIDAAVPAVVDRVVDLVILVAQADIRAQRVGDVERRGRVQRRRPGVAAAVDVEVVVAAAVDLWLVARDASDHLAALLHDLELHAGQGPQIVARRGGGVEAERGRAAVERPGQADVVGERLDVLADLPGADALDELVRADGPSADGAGDRAGERDTIV